MAAAGAAEIICTAYCVLLHRYDHDSEQEMDVLKFQTTEGDFIVVSKKFRL